MDFIMVYPSKWQHSSYLQCIQNILTIWTLNENFHLGIKVFQKSLLLYTTHLILDQILSVLPKSKLIWLKIRTTQAQSSYEKTK